MMGRSITPAFLSDKSPRKDSPLGEWVPPQRGFWSHRTNERLFVDLLNLVKGKVAISGYDSPLYSEQFPAPKWRKYIDIEKPLRERNCSSTRREVLWMNYDP